jgi:hypothetical protein
MGILGGHNVRREPVPRQEIAEGRHAHSCVRLSWHGVGCEKAAVVQISIWSEAGEAQGTGGEDEPVASTGRGGREGR